jgi:cation transporter-like permease
MTVTPEPQAPPGAGPDRAARPVLPHAGIASTVGARLAAMLLGGACVAWTATPLLHKGLAQFALFVAIVAVVAGALRLAFADVPQPEDQFFLPGYLRTWLTFLQFLRIPAWEETAVVAILWLEIMHPLRGWHTAALGAGLLGYLLATHIAESGAAAGPLLGRQAKTLLVGACLLALGAGFATITAAAPGAGSAVLRVIAAVAVIAATALVIPS